MGNWEVWKLKGSVLSGIISFTVFNDCLYILFDSLLEILGVGQTSEWIYDLEASGVSIWEGPQDPAVSSHSPGLQWRWWAPWVGAATSTPRFYI